MSESGTKGAVVAAIAVNVFVTAIKFVAFALSGSGSMFSEAMHTFADTGNQILLYMGIRRSERPADTKFHYGYGNERFLFALLSAAGIFVLGCGVTVYHGVHSLIDPHELSVGWIDFTVLGVGFCLDGSVLLKAFRVVLKQKGKMGLMQFLRTTSDPTLLAVLFEDCVACFGVFLALGGIGLSYWLHSPIPDAIGSILIGLLLGFVALWLGTRNRALIVGAAIPREDENKMVEWLKAQPSVELVRAVRTRIVGSDQYSLKATLDFRGATLAEHLMGWLEDQPVVKTGTPDQTPAQRLDFAREFAEKLMQAQGAEINRIEGELRKMFPQLLFIDLEAD